MTARFTAFLQGRLALKSTRVAVAAMLLPFLVNQAAICQTNEERNGLILRQLSLSGGYVDVQLPPLTLGGKLPEAALQEDVVASGTVGLGWRHGTPATTYSFDFFGAYAARTRHSPLSAPAVDLSLGVSHALGRRWRVGADAANVVTSTDQVILQPTHARQLVDAAASFSDPADEVALARSPAPDPKEAALFVPISQSLADAQLFSDRLMASSLRLHASYAHSTRLTTSLRGSYTTVRQITARHDPTLVREFPDSIVEGAGVGIRYDRSQRTQVAANLEWSRASGASLDNVLLATVGYGWTGRKWFTEATIGAALRPFQTAVEATSGVERPAEIVYSGAIGYKFRPQTLLFGYSRAPHDEYGHGGQDAATGFTGNVHSFIGAWSWRPPRSRWLVQADVSMVRRPGNFSYINAWLATAAVGRQVAWDVRVMAELLFDRHGSRGFEGFHLTREGVRVTFIWTPHRRGPENSDPQDQSGFEP